MLESIRNAFRSEPEVAHTGYVEEISRPERRRKQSRPLNYTMNELLGVLKTAEGQAVTYQQLADVMGYKGVSAISRAIDELMRRKAITRRGKRGRYVFHVKRETVRRIRKSSQASKPTHREGITEKQKAFLRYMARHQYKPISQNEIADALNLKPGSVYHFVDNLCRKGLLERSGPTKDGTVYRVVDSSDRGPNPEPKDEDAEKTSLVNEQQLFNVIESLSWEYMNDHWNTNLLQFLSWLKQQKLKK